MFGAFSRSFLWLIGLSAALACGSRSELRKGPGGLLATPDVAPPQEEEELPNCIDLDFFYAPQPATVLLLIDQSGSMVEDFGGRARWDVVRDALFANEGLLPVLEEEARFGLMFYSSLDGFQGGTCPLLETTEILFDNAAQLGSIFDVTEPLAGGDTPTGEAIDAAVSALLADGARGPKYIVLITDGEPDTCAIPDPQGGQSVAILSAQRAFAAGITLYVVGVSDEIAIGHLQQMANVGQGVEPGSVWGEDAEAIRPIQASEESAELAEQLRGALGDVRTCSVPLGTVPEGTGEVYLDGDRLWLNRDFELDGDVMLLGDEACQKVLGAAQELELNFDCGGSP